MTNTMTPQAPSDEAINQFWTWFRENISRLEVLNREIETVDELKRHLAEIGATGWEIGPSSSPVSSFFFAFSTMGDRQIYAINRKIVSRAPPIKGWELLPAKPRKDWHRRFQWCDRTVDASEWKFLMFRYDDGMYDLALMGNVINDFPQGEKSRILAFVVESELGEAISLERVSGLEFNQQPTPDEASSSVEIARLFDHLGSHRLQ